MSHLICPYKYASALSAYETQKGIDLIRKSFENELSKKLNLKRVSAPLFVASNTGINDDLNGTERAVEFDILETKTNAQIVHSLAKWKRLALYNYGFSVGEGIFTNMNAVRRDETMDNLHSIYVDQWDWEKIIDQSSRNIKTLKKTVQSLVNAICKTQSRLKKQFPQLKTELTNKISFVTTQELENLYPDLSPKQRENEFLKTHKTAFIMQIGGKLISGLTHDGRAPDYDDWNLNGDIVFWNELLSCAFEVSSMGIRVSPSSLSKQLELAGCTERSELSFHKMLLSGQLPQTMGGGIGQSRLCMLLLEKAHIGEVQVSIWDKSTLRECEKNKIRLL